MFETEIVYFFSTTLIYTVFLKSRFDFDYSFFFSVFLASVVNLIDTLKKIVSSNPMETPRKCEILLLLPFQRQALFKILIIGNDF